ncbi:MAG TPA: hypothetical protein VGN34_29745 [Ktedonobacteraceae bacterium]|jgi:transcriptional regulatory protein LevR
MDQDIQVRLKVYEQEELASPAVVAFVRDILLWLEQTSHHPCTEETAGTFASHLMLALTRVQHGETLESLWDQGVHEEAEKLHVLDSWATHIQQQTQEVLGLTLPHEEVDFVLLHLGTFLMHYDDPLVSHIVA